MSNVLDDHSASVVVAENNDLMFVSPQINTVKLDNRIVKIVPGADEEVVSLYDHRDKFRNLEFIDILLTNACNLSCTYCYEQHQKDFGRFTPEIIRKAWDWLRDINDTFPKYIQFFGGEPLIHKKLILEFMRENRDELTRMYGKQTVSITTNGLLLTDEFIDEYFSYPGVKMMISLDTIDHSLDHRGITKEQMTKLLDTIEKVAKKVERPDLFAIRATISREGAPFIKEFWAELYRRGVRQLIFHPLILSYGEGFIEWTDEEWTTFTKDIREIISTSRDVVHFHVAEGVGVKGRTNCMIGSDEIAIDPSGDFSGCYFFTNRKQQVGGMTLGNIFDDALYLNRYTNMENAYEEMYKQYPECQSCDVQSLCYQCPAGNVSTSGKLFRPDGMCKRFIRLYADIAHLNLTKLCANDMAKLIGEYKAEYELALSRSLVRTAYRYFRNEDFTGNWTFVDYQLMAGYFYHLMTTDTEMPEDPRDVIDGAVRANTSMTPSELYFAILKRHSLANLVPNVQQFYPEKPDVPYTGLVEILVGINRLSKGV